ncbi:MAG: hypothetical protein MOB07_22475 [Acidobacteria bacterium]|nr:hypothetical protein [Acidobacteriota bacterium]MCI0666287.1 hypothetical protein [Acidobacteriota bacterium]
MSEYPLIADRTNHRVGKVDIGDFINTIGGEGNPTGMIIDPEIRQRKSLR